MITTLLQVLIAFIVLAGAVFVLAAAIGLNRLPDVYSRMHAASKAGTVGSGLMLFAAGLQAGDSATLVRALAGFFFFVLTAPISAHLLAMAARKVGYPLASESVLDQMKNQRKSI